MRDYLLTLIVVGLVPVAVMRPWIGVLAWHWIGLMNPHRLTWDFAYTMQFAAMIAVATLVGLVFTKDRKPVPSTAEMWLMGVLLACFAFTTPFAWAPDHAWAQLEKVAKIILMTLVTTMLIFGRERIRMLFLVLALSIGFFGVKGGIFTLRTGGGEMVQGPEGSFIEGNTFIGLALNMVIPVLVAIALEEKNRWFRRGLYLAVALSVVSVIFTYSRGAWLGLAAIAPFVIMQLPGKAIKSALVAVIAALIVAAPIVFPDRIFTRADALINYETDCSANQRLMSWVVHWNIATTYPLTGAGFNFEESTNGRYLEFGTEKYAHCFDAETSAAHNIYFQILGQHGFVTFGLWLALLVIVQVKLTRLRKAARLSLETSWMATYATGLQIGLVGYLVSGAFLSSAYFDLPWLYYALLVIMMRELQSGSLREVSDRTGARAAGILRASPGQ
jgi:probable O-glycosylation ligase (exosortase A-associated)